MLASNSRAVVIRGARFATNRISSSATVSSTTDRRFVTSTNVIFEKHITKVPTMGDSITEGTVVEWTAQVGQKVEEEDVVALIETDKVTVDIKASISGVISKQFGNIDDEVEVGADLYEIDTEAEATVEATKEVEPAQTIESVSAPSPSSPPTGSMVPDTSSNTPSPRIPSIRFLGKEGWERALTVEPEFVIPATYGRLDLSEEEMEALLSGGANLAPEIKEYSSGAVFSG